ncbi:hypothetical protein DL93DRAFT_2095525 [Clavulina sp. PMI_390]|nr:hypothetical protein DL93DRAFT_2095525 [Clavulina sp. PMI_390]
MRGFRLWLPALVSLVARVSALELMWPNYPEFGTDQSVQFWGGITPYKLQVLNDATSAVYFTYNGNDNVTYWCILRWSLHRLAILTRLSPRHVNADPGILVLFRVTDAGGGSLTSSGVVITPNPAISSASVQSASQASVSQQSVASRASVSRASTANQPANTPTTTTSSTTSPTSTSSSSTTTTSSPSGTVANGTAGSPSTTSSTSTSVSSTSGPASDNSPTQTPAKHSMTGALAGGVVGGVVVIGAIILLVLYWLRRRSNRSEGSMNVPTSAYLSPDDRMRYFDNRTETATFITGTGAASLYTAARSASFPEDPSPMQPSFMGSNYATPAMEPISEFERQERYPPAAAHFSGLPEVHQ